MPIHAPTKVPVKAPITINGMDAIPTAMTYAKLSILKAFLIVINKVVPTVPTTPEDIPINGPATNRYWIKSPRGGRSIIYPIYAL